MAGGFGWGGREDLWHPREWWLPRGSSFRWRTDCLTFLCAVAVAVAVTAAVLRSWAATRVGAKWSAGPDWWVVACYQTVPLRLATFRCRPVGWPPVLTYRPGSAPLGPLGPVVGPVVSYPSDPSFADLLAVAVAVGMPVDCTAVGPACAGPTWADPPCDDPTAAAYTGVAIVAGPGADAGPALPAGP